MGHVDALSRCHQIAEVEKIEEAASLRSKVMPKTKKIADTDEAVIHKLNAETAEKTIHRRTIAVADYDDIDFRLQVTQNRDPTIADIKNKLESTELDDYLRLVSKTSASGICIKQFGTQHNKKHS